MVLNGPNTKAQLTSSEVSQPVLTIAQLLMHNSFVRRWESQSKSTTMYSLERETPLPIYLGMMIHTETRKHEVVDDLYELGLSISYNHVLDISTELGNKICRH